MLWSIVRCNKIITQVNWSCNLINRRQRLLLNYIKGTFWWFMSTQDRGCQYKTTVDRNSILYLCFQIFMLPNPEIEAFWMTCCHPEGEVLPQPEVTGLIQKSVGEIFDTYAIMKENWVIVVIPFLPKRLWNTNSYSITVKYVCLTEKNGFFFFLPKKM